MNSGSETARAAAHRLRVGTPLTQSLELLRDSVETFRKSVVDGGREGAEPTSASGLDVTVTTFLGGLWRDWGQSSL